MPPKKPPVPHGDPSDAPENDENVRAAVAAAAAAAAAAGGHGHLHGVEHHEHPGHHQHEEHPEDHMLAGHEPHPPPPVEEPGMEHAHHHHHPQHHQQHEPPAPRDDGQVPVMGEMPRDVQMKDNLEKRKRKILSIETKIDIIKRVEKGEKMAKVAQELGIGTSTVSEIVTKQKGRLEAYGKSMAAIGNLSEGLSRKKLKTGRYPELEERLFAWYREQRSLGVQVQTMGLKDKARFFYNQVASGAKSDGPQGAKLEFRASDGWLDSFKHRYGIHLTGHVAEKNTIMKGLKSEIEQLGVSQDQIYMADEFALFTKSMPRSVFGDSANDKRGDLFADDSLVRFKDRVTCLVCSSANGTSRLRPALIGRTDQPTVLMNANYNGLPAMYYTQVYALMDHMVFQMWFNTEFVPHVRAELKRKGLPMRAILLMSKNRGHYPIEWKSSEHNPEELYKVMFLPSSPPTVNEDGSGGVAQPHTIHPMRHGVSVALAHAYKNELATIVHHRQLSEPNLRLSDIVQAFSLRDALYAIAEGWRRIPNSLIEKCFQTSWPSATVMPNPGFDEPLDIPSIDETTILLQNIEKLATNKQAKVSSQDIEHWINMEQNLPVVEGTTVVEDLAANDEQQDALQTVISQQRADGYDSDEENRLRGFKRSGDYNKPVPTQSEALNGLYTYQRWMESHIRASPEECRQIYQLERFAFESLTNPHVHAQPGPVAPPLPQGTAPPPAPPAPTLTPSAAAAASVAAAAASAAAKQAQAQQHHHDPHEDHVGHHH